MRQEKLRELDFEVASWNFANILLKWVIKSPTKKLQVLFKDDRDNNQILERIQVWRISYGKNLDYVKR